MPSAAARSLTVTPERTVAGPVGRRHLLAALVRCSPRPRRPRWRVSRCGREAAVSITTRRRPPSWGPRCGRATREPPGGVGAGAVAAGGRPRRRRLRARWPGRARGAARGAPRGRAPPAAAPPGARCGGAAAGAAPARGARRDWKRPPPRARAARPRRPCRPAGARRPRRGGEPPLRDRARARGRCRLHAFSASQLMGQYQGAAAPPAALRTACQSPSGRSRARAGSDQAGPARAMARPRTPRSGRRRRRAPGRVRRPRAPRSQRACSATSSCCGRSAHRAGADAARADTAHRRSAPPRPSPGGRAGRRSASRGSRCSGSACPTP